MNFNYYFHSLPTTSRQASEVAAQIFQKQNLDKSNILGKLSLFLIYFIIWTTRPCVLWHS